MHCRSTLEDSTEHNIRHRRNMVSRSRKWEGSDQQLEADRKPWRLLWSTDHLIELLLAYRLTIRYCCSLCIKPSRPGPAQALDCYPTTVISPGRQAQYPLRMAMLSVSLNAFTSIASQVSPSTCSCRDCLDKLLKQWLVISQSEL